MYTFHGLGTSCVETLWSIATHDYLDFIIYFINVFFIFMIFILCKFLITRFSELDMLICADFSGSGGWSNWIWMGGWKRHNAATIVAEICHISMFETLNILEAGRLQFPVLIYTITIEFVWFIHIWKWIDHIVVVTFVSMYQHRINSNLQGK